MADAKLSRLYVQMSHESDGEIAKLMARIALDLTPTSIDALDQLTELVADEAPRELSARYERFLSEAPSHPQSPRVREALIELLLELRDYDAALRQVRCLSGATGSDLRREQIVRACDVAPAGREPYEPDAAEWVDEFELDTADFVHEVSELELTEIVE